jgi:hypothetical protein
MIGAIRANPNWARPISDFRIIRGNIPDELPDGFKRLRIEDR